MSTPDKKLGGYSVHVGDCYIWSEIYYLDSPTDYRECLPPHRICPRNIPSGGFSILEPSENNLGHFLLRILVFLAACLIICSLLWDNLQ